jgi:hypothetical protein
MINTPSANARNHDDGHRDSMESYFDERMKAVRTGTEA